MDNSKTNHINPRRKLSTPITVQKVITYSSNVQNLCMNGYKTNQPILFLWLAMVALVGRFATSLIQKQIFTSRLQTLTLFDGSK